MMFVKTMLKSMVPFLVLGLILATGCSSDDTGLGKPPVDGDNTSVDGDATADGDNVADGDALVDGDATTDGDQEPVDGDVVDGDGSDGDAIDGDAEQ